MYYRTADEEQSGKTQVRTILSSNEAFHPTSTFLRKMVAELRGIAGGATGRTVMWC
jgi:hypothetical protein